MVKREDDDLHEKNGVAVEREMLMFYVENFYYLEQNV